MSTRLEKYKKIYCKYHYMTDTTVLDVVFGTVFANRLDEKPVWLYMVGPPSCGKTQAVQPLTKSDEIVSLSRITPSALVSGFDRGKKKKTKKTSLLPYLDGKTLIITDFTAMLCMNYKALMDVLGQLRNAYEGESATAFGLGQVAFKSKFGIIACVTGAIDRHAKMVADLGERFVAYQMPDITKFEEAKRCMMAMSLESLSEKEEELSKAAIRVLKAKSKPATITKKDKIKLYKVCQVVAHARAAVQRDSKTYEPEIPAPEAAIRLSGQLATLARGIAMAREKKKVTRDEIDLVQKIAIHSVTAKRRMLIKSLLSFWPEYVPLDKIIDSMKFKFSDMAVRRWLEEMLLLGLVNRKSTLSGKGTTYYRWQLVDGRLLKSVLFGE